FSLSRVIYIPNGVRIDNSHKLLDFEKDTLRKRLNLPFGKLVVYTGQINRTKGIFFLLKAWELIQKGRHDVSLILIGETNDLALQRLLKSDEKIYCIGKVENISDYLKGADIFVLPSFSEGMSNSLLEAMSYGLSIVATNIGGNRELIIDQKNGLLVEPEDVQGLATAILKLIKDESLAKGLGEQAKRDIKKYNINRIANNYIRLYSEILS
ncbi:unnamed protein product, partial [marine sediment metagenome]